VLHVRLILPFYYADILYKETAFHRSEPINYRYRYITKTLNLWWNWLACSDDMQFLPISHH